MKDGDTFGVGSYPIPKEIEEKTIHAKMYVSFEIECEIPKYWDEDKIRSYLKANYSLLDADNVKIEEIEL